MISPTIVVVDDEAAVLNVVTHFLEVEGYRVFPASTASEAFRVAVAQLPNLVVSDVLMPEMDGFELVRRLRGESKLSATPVILMSGVFNDNAGIELARNFGVRHFLSKPFTEESLLASVAMALRSPFVRSSIPEKQLEREQNRVLSNKLREKIDALTESESRLRLSVSASNIGYWDWNLILNEVFFSPEWKAQLGYAENELSNRFEEWQSRLHPEDAAPTLAKLQCALDDPAVRFSAEFRLRHKNGSHRWILTQANVLRNNGGRPVRMMGCHIDVTERKESERNAALRARQQAAVAELSQRALAKAPLKELLCEAVILLTRGLEVEFSKVLELSPGNRGFNLVAGVGWREGIVGRALVENTLDSQAGYTLLCGDPVIVGDFRRETRFRSSALLREHGVASGISIRIGGHSDPWGVLGAHSLRPRTFAEDDINFLGSVAGVLGAVVALQKAELELRQSKALVVRGFLRLMSAEDGERRRIARELHDSTAQDLVAAMMTLESWRDAVAAGGSGEPAQIDDSLALLENCAHEIRTLSYLLHPPQLDAAGLTGSIRHYVAGFGKRTGIVTNTDLPEKLEQLEATVEMVLFRVIQEALGNIHRHANSKTASVCLKQDAFRLVLEVRDEGGGIALEILRDFGRNADGLGVGISGMRERMRQIGGNLEIDSNPRGTTVRAVLPYPLATEGSNA